MQFEEDKKTENSRRAICQIKSIDFCGPKSYEIYAQFPPALTQRERRVLSNRVNGVTPWYASFGIPPNTSSIWSNTPRVSSK